MDRIYSKGGVLFLYKHVIDKRRIIFILIIYASVLILLSVRLYFLQVRPSTQVQGELQNHQIETLAELNYRILDTNGKDLLRYKKKYVLVIDSCIFLKGESNPWIFEINVLL